MPKHHFSQSELYLWNSDRDAYIRKYIEGVEELPTRAQTQGILIHEAIKDEKFPIVEKMKEAGFLRGEIFRAKKALDKIVRAPEREKPLVCDFAGIKLITIPDGIDLDKKELYEYKTTDNIHAWTQRRVDLADQLSFEALVYHQLFHSYFRIIRLWRILTTKGTVKKFETARSYRDLLYIGDKIKSAVYEIQRAGLWEKRLSREDIEYRKKVDRKEVLV